MAEERGRAPQPRWSAARDCAEKAMTGVKVATEQDTPTPMHDTMAGVTARETILAGKARNDIVGMEGSLLSFRSPPRAKLSTK
jgi:hypothetical protein